MSFRILNQAPQYLLASGAVNSGGSLTFYETDLSTLKDTWSDEELDTLNSNPVVMDAFGRTLTDVWGDGEYGVVMKNSAGVVQWTRNNVRDLAPDADALPAQAEGFLYSDGADMSWEEIREVPDPTGLANYYLTSDGTGTPVWVQIPESEEPPDPEYDIEAGFIRIGTLLDQWGTGTIAAASGAQTANVAVVFAEPFSATPYHCSATITNAGGSTASGRIGSLAVTNLSTTGCTVTVNVGEDDTRSDFKLTNSTPFSYRVVGPTTA